MPEVTKEGSKEPIEVRIKQVRNGFRVCGFRDNEPTDHEYVYKKLKEALKEIEGMFSVLEQDMPKTTESDLDKEEERINKGEY